jgi:hypothetical protein
VGARRSSDRCGRCWLKWAAYSLNTVRRCRSPKIRIRSVHSERAVRTQRSAKAHEPCADLHHEEDVQATQGDGVNGEEITRQHAGGLSVDEVPPPITLPAGRGAKPCTFQQPTDRRAAHPVAKPFTADPLLPPRWILPGQPFDQRHNPGGGRRSATAALGVGPFSGDQTAMPAQQRARCHQPMCPQRLR